MSLTDSSYFFYSKSHTNNLDLTDEQWELVKSILTPLGQRVRPGRPPVPIRQVLAGVLWKLRTAAAWDDLPPQYPSHQTCYRYYRRWLRTGFLDDVIRVLTSHLELNGLDLSMALEFEEIELVDARLGGILHFSPTLQGTWQAATAQLLLQVLYTKARRSGLAKGKLIPTFPGGG